jgi:PAS domain S-box-containing protein
MVGGNRKIAAAAELRQGTRRQLDRTLMSAELPQTDVDVRKLVHELQTHQIGLEMQNAELLQIRADLESSLARYTGLYDFAPVSYFTLTSDGLIQEANLTAAALLGAVRADLMGQRLEQFVAHESQAVFRAFLKKVFSGHVKQTCEAALLHADQGPRFVHITATVHVPGEKGSGQPCRLAMVDVTERKKAEEALRKSREELRELASYQERVKEDERKRIAREIHDDLGQNLLALRLDIAMLHTRTADLHPHLHKKFGTALTHIDATMKAVRSAINNLRPAVLDLGLHAAIEWQVQDFQRRTGIACKLMAETGPLVLDDNRATAVFRILQESLNNVVRHAKASQVDIALYCNDGKLFLRVKDNGIGIYPNCRRKTNVFGLIGIRERLLALGGEFGIESEPGHGTTLTMWVPIDD